MLFSISLKNNDENDNKNNNKKTELRPGENHFIPKEASVRDFTLSRAASRAASAFASSASLGVSAFFFFFFICLIAGARPPSSILEVWPFTSFVL